MANNTNTAEREAFRKWAEQERAAGCIGDMEKGWLARASLAVRAHNIVALSQLPPPAHNERIYGGHGNEIVHSYYTEHQMREYARQEVFRAEEAWQARASLAAPKAGTGAEREALQAYLKDCDAHAIVPDVGGAWHAAFQAGRASLAASAGSEPVATIKSWTNGSYWRNYNVVFHRDDLPVGTDLYTHPYPPEGKAGWKPIETAPKDGTEILLYAPDCEYEGSRVKSRTTYGHWRAPSDTPSIKYQDGFAPEPEWEDFEPFWASWDGGFTEEHPPTHWMPLPAPPLPASETKEP